MSGAVTLFSPAAFASPDAAFADVVGATDPNIFLNGLEDVLRVATQLDPEGANADVQKFLGAIFPPSNYRTLSPQLQEAYRELIAGAIRTNHALFARAHKVTVLASARRFAASAADAVSQLVPRSPEDPSVTMNAFLKELGLPEGPFTSAIVRRLYSLPSPVMPSEKNEKRALVKSLIEAMTEWWGENEWVPHDPDFTKEPDPERLNWFVDRLEEFLPEYTLAIAWDERVDLVDAVTKSGGFSALSASKDSIIALRGIGMSDHDIYEVITQAAKVCPQGEGEQLPEAYDTLNEAIHELSVVGYNNGQITRAIKVAAKAFLVTDYGIFMDDVYKTLGLIGVTVHDLEPDLFNREKLFFQMIGYEVLYGERHGAVVEVLRGTKRYTGPQIQKFMRDLRKGASLHGSRTSDDAFVRSRDIADAAFVKSHDEN